jgi:putative membrane protein
MGTVRTDSRPLTVPAACFAAWFAVWAVCAISPNDRTDWLLENLLTFAATGTLLATFPLFRFSDRAYAQITAFMILHAIGGHYTYSQVPIGDWMKDALGLARNHFDRIVHFSFGLLMMRPMRELGFRNAPHLGRFAKLYFSTAGIGLWSMAYEILEWLVAAIVDPSAGTAYLGTQGDEWDAQKDMAFALLGAFIAALFQYRDGRPTTE